VQEPPGADKGGEDEKAEGLVAAEETALLGAALLLACLLSVGLNARLHPETV